MADYAIPIPNGYAELGINDFAEQYTAGKVTKIAGPSPIAEYPDHYQWLYRDERDVGQDNFARRAWWLIVYHSLDGGTTRDSGVAFMILTQGDQPSFPVSWTEEKKKRECDLNPEGCPQKSPIWPWVLVGGALGFAAILASGSMKRRRRR